MSGQLTTHILDTATGKPARGVKIELWRQELALVLLGKFVTNQDGRLDQPLLAGDEFKVGQYELRFFAGDYWRAQKLELPEPAFLDVIPLRFGIAAADQHYHVPLLLSPYGYSTYRGS